MRGHSTPPSRLFAPPAGAAAPQLPGPTFGPLLMKGAAVYATEDYARRLAATRLIELAATDLRDAAAMRESIEALLRTQATGPGGMALLEGGEVAAAIMLARRMEADAREAVGSLNAAADLLRDID